MSVNLSDIISWVWGHECNLRPGKLERLDYTIRMTTKCRQNTIKRLETKESLSFAVTIVTSLIMILIPLLKLGGTEHRFSDNAIVIVQCFFAISFLVYSISPI